ncbi:hypothetical protein PPACK8108_LOCUS19316, partial [Phakopsora pachyrhizi]
TYAAPPPGYVTPDWPGLYNPLKDGVYLYVPFTIWKFTLYWTLLLEGIVFITCGLFASFTLSRSQRWRYNQSIVGEEITATARQVRPRFHPNSQLVDHSSNASIITTIQRLPRKHQLPPRPSMYTLFIPPLIFTLASTISSVISGSLTGWAIAALYNSALLRTSTWVPAIWSAGLILIVIISSYSSVATVM